MWNSKMFDQWRSYLSLKTPILLIFFLLWNLGFVVAMYGFGKGFGSPITENAGVVISIVCICACIFSSLVAFSDTLRLKLLEPKRIHNYRAKDFYLLSFITLSLSISMLFIPGLSSV